MKSFVRLAFLFFLSYLPLLALPAWAALGGKAESIASDKKTLNMRDVSARSLNGFRFEEMVTSGQKIRVRQFISDTGQVFAITWQGRIDGQLAPLLGAYAADFAKHETEKPPRSGKIPYRRVKAGRVVVEFWDMLRRVQGKAYVPALMPADVKPEQIKISE